MNNPYIRELQEQREQMIDFIQSRPQNVLALCGEIYQENLYVLDAEIDFYRDIEQLALDVKQIPPEPKSLNDMDLAEQRVWFAGVSEIDPDA